MKTHSITNLFLSASFLIVWCRSASFEPRNFTGKFNAVEINNITYFCFKSLMSSEKYQFVAYFLHFTAEEGKYTIENNPNTSPFYLKISFDKDSTKLILYRFKFPSEDLFNKFLTFMIEPFEKKPDTVTEDEFSKLLNFHEISKDTFKIKNMALEFNKGEIEGVDAFFPISTQNFESLKLTFKLRLPSADNQTDGSNLTEKPSIGRMDAEMENYEYDGLSEIKDEPDKMNVINRLKIIERIMFASKKDEVISSNDVVIDTDKRNTHKWHIWIIVFVLAFILVILGVVIGFLIRKKSNRGKINFKKSIRKSRKK